MDGTLTNFTCPHPFLARDAFPDVGGFVWGRSCRDFALDTGSVSCCVPCPWSSWRYSDGFEEYLDIAGWCGIAVVVIVVLFLITFAVVPKIYTARHYLTTVPGVGFVFLSVAYVMPLAKAPNQCYNEITPNDNSSDSMCTATSTVLFIGVWLVVISCFFRSVSLHLIVVWERKLGRKFKYMSLTCIFLLTILLVALQQRVTGTSYQLGKVCYLNPINGWVTFWMPLLGMGVVSFILQVWTLGYCLLNVFRGMWEDRVIAAYNEENNNEDGGGGSSNSNSNNENGECHDDNTNESHLSSVRSWRGEEGHGGPRRNSLATQKLLTSMQWRPMFAAFGVLIYVALITVIFMMLRVEDRDPAEKFDNWVSCLIVSSGDKNRCMSYLSDLGPDENLVVVTFFLLALAGIWAILIVMRFDMIAGWIDVLNGRARQQSPSSAIATDPEDQLPLHQVSTNTLYATSFNTTPSLPVADMK
ncbi:uncharacterized protein TRUGW13939_11256 [Talaromyces rugulosus]|uniref:G-protein coupled receptors family 2 profile 2 domain-containing protein n=1 Tax=Talaromyces rugulosus TaxID=121627 RepID=A0A7H8RHM7_TALRU|nr:uncharacterized protein TRUGW13939_11256 [Talaromyces rugulosus]QKX64083.1 hypothetical protein TRUGW13939_11256 [Talaromyces rugulosus]